MSETGEKFIAWSRMLVVASWCELRVRWYGYEAEDVEDFANYRRAAWYWLRTQMAAWLRLGPGHSAEEGRS